MIKETFIVAILMSAIRAVRLDSKEEKKVEQFPQDNLKQLAEQKLTDLAQKI
jgi:hypothetical protein